jgi:hypothetical protein
MVVFGFVVGLVLCGYASSEDVVVIRMSHVILKVRLV